MTPCTLVGAAAAHDAGSEVGSRHAAAANTIMECQDKESEADVADLAVEPNKMATPTVTLVLQ